MAYVNESFPRPPFFATLRHSLFRAMVFLAERSTAAKCARHAARLSEMSDEELAKRGLKRDEIIRHAFRQYIF